MRVQTLNTCVSFGPSTSHNALRTLISMTQCRPAGERGHTDPRPADFPTCKDVSCSAPMLVLDHAESSPPPRVLSISVTHLLLNWEHQDNLQARRSVGLVGFENQAQRAVQPYPNVLHPPTPLAISLRRYERRCDPGKPDSIPLHHLHDG